MALSRWLRSLPALLLGVIVAVPSALAVWFLVEELLGSGPGSRWALVGLAWFALGLVVAAAVLWAFFTARSELDRRGQVMAAAAATSSDWLWDSDVDGRITFCNEAATVVLGYRPEELLASRASTSWPTRAPGAGLARYTGRLNAWPAAGTTSSSTGPTSRGGHWLWKARARTFGTGADESSGSAAPVASSARIEPLEPRWCQPGNGSERCWPAARSTWRCSR